MASTLPRQSFLRLPGELRNRIYEGALRCKVLIYVDRHARLRRRRSMPGYNPLQCHNLNLFLVCRKLHQEAAPIFYSINNFALDGPNNLDDLCDHIGYRNAGYVTTLRQPLEVVYGFFDHWSQIAFRRVPFLTSLKIFEISQHYLLTKNRQQFQTKALKFAKLVLEVSPSLTRLVRIRKEVDCEFQFRFVTDDYQLEEGSKEIFVDIDAEIALLEG